MYLQNAGSLVFRHRGHVHTYEAYRRGCANSHDEATCRGCQFRGTCDIFYREDGDPYLPGRYGAVVVSSP
jgi:hypothetical protein